MSLIFIGVNIYTAGTTVVAIAIQYISMRQHDDNDYVYVVRYGDD